jgi:uncharacterized membrane protein YfcA
MLFPNDPPEIVTSISLTCTHFITGPFHAGTGRAVALSIGAILGARAGAMLSQKIHGEWIIRSLALALGLVGFDCSLNRCDDRGMISKLVT